MPRLRMTDRCANQRCQENTYREEFQRSDHRIVPLHCVPEMKRNVAAGTREMQARPVFSAGSLRV
jgi:hypothetical protein